MPSSLAAGHSSALVFSTGPPVSVCGTGHTTVMLRSFSRKYDYLLQIGRSLFLLSSSSSMTDLPIINITTLFNVPYRRQRSSVTFSSLRRPIIQFRNINLMSVAAPFRVVLRPRLTLIRLTLIRNPWSSGVNVSHIHYRYLCLHLLFLTLQQPSQIIFAAVKNAPLPNSHCCLLA